jgi:STE24 endopeptidase
MIEPNPLLLTYLSFYLLRSGTQFLLNRLNIAHLRKYGSKVPEVFQDIIDREKLKKIRAYTVDSARFGIFSTLASQGFFLVLLLSGFLPWLVELLRRPGWGLILSAWGFFASLGILTTLFHIPFDLYDTFMIETRYGFNTRTFRLWLLDLLKNLVLSALLSGGLLWLLLTLIIHGGKAWWFWAWILVGLVEWMIIWLYPVILAPLFNKFEPLVDQELLRRIEKLMEKSGLRAKGVFQMDASKRSKHTNAYFTGLGKSKRIVLFDTLLHSHSSDEIEAVLAHEVGHWKKGHVFQELVLVEVLSLAGFYLLSRLLKWPLLYETFGFRDSLPYVGLFLAGALVNPMTYFARPLASFYSRRLEREADDFALSLLPSVDPLIKAFKRLAADNLSNLTPHPLYSWFYYSHPSLAERIMRLKRDCPSNPKPPI